MRFLEPRSRCVPCSPEMNEFGSTLRWSTAFVLCPGDGGRSGRRCALGHRRPVTRPRFCRLFLADSVSEKEVVKVDSKKFLKNDVETSRSRSSGNIDRSGSSGGGGGGPVVVDVEKSVRKPKRTLTEETKARISASMAGKKKSAEMKEKVSRALKGRVPWNKGKKLTSEVRKRMSFARFGQTPWNKGQRLSEKHRKKISEKMTGREVSQETRRKLQMARRRPGDNVVVSSKSQEQDEEGSFSLVSTEHIHEFVSLRRELRVWSDEFANRVGRRPSISDVRRLAELDVVANFERYLRLRDRIRGLAKDVYGCVNPKEIPVEAPRKRKEPRVIRVQRTGVTGAENRSDSKTVPAIKQGTEDEEDGEDELPQTLSKNDYRLLGKYRLMESNDIHTFIQLRAELKKFSDAFKKKEGRIPALSDIKDSGQTLLYQKFEMYLSMSDKMRGLVTEVYGMDFNNLEELEQVSERGQRILETLRYSRTPNQHDEGADNSSDSLKPLSSIVPRTVFMPGVGEILTPS